MDGKSVYFTWPDETFFYECRGCADCCKGLGIGLDELAGQGDALVRLYPHVTPFLRRRGATLTAFNPRGQCWFLAADGLCAVERDHGRAAKPASCRLFPFNRVFRLGAFTIVDYNSVICPLRATLDVPAPGQPRTVSHAEILAEIESIADPAVVGTTLPVEGADEARLLISRERSLAEVCFAEAAAATPELAAVWRAHATSEGALDHATERLSRALDLLTGQRSTAPSTTMTRIALWLTPSLRFNELYGPRAYDSRAERTSVLPAMWLAWLHFLAMAETLSLLPLDLRGATSLWSELAPLTYLAARMSHAPTMEPGAVELPGAGDPDRVIARLAEACIANRKARRSLAELLGPLIASYAPHERVVLARLVEPLLQSIRWRRPRA